MAFYVIENHRFDKNGFAYGLEKGKVNTGEFISCEACKSPLTMLEWMAPFEVNLSNGKLGDLVFGTYSHFIVSENFKEIYCKNGFNGILAFEPVTLYLRGVRIVERYYYPKILLSNAPIDIHKSKILFEGTEECSICQKAGRVIKKINGLYFADEDIIKCDIFCTKILPNEIIFSELFKDAIKDLSNLSFKESNLFVPSWII